MTHRLATPEWVALATLRRLDDKSNHGTEREVVRHHQIGHGLPPVLATLAWTEVTWRMPNAGDPGLEHKENVQACNTLASGSAGYPYLREKE